ncbi:MAG: zf-HC2 domain-containing protein [Candidatus Aminicenantales bacterium]
MNCHRAKSLLPLAAGGDLPGRKTGRLEPHLKKCAGCREELHAYQAALSEMRSLASMETQPDWPESEWRRIMQLAIAQGPEKTQQVFEHSNRRLAWTLGSALILMLAVGSVLIFRDRRDREILQPSAPLSSPELKESSARPKAESQPPLRAEKISAGQAIKIQAPKKQDVVNMVFVSPESGLTIHWVFNSEFDWKEK